MVSAGPMPGSMPMRVPRVTPRRDHRRFWNVSAVEKPSSREASALTGQRYPVNGPAGNGRLRSRVNRR